MKQISNDDLAELVNGIDTYLATCLATFEIAPTTLLAVMLSRMTQMAQIVGGEDTFVLLLDYAKETIMDPPDIDKPMRH
jgi:hypothetical protein